MAHKIVGEAEWLQARRELLAREKEFTAQRDALSELRRQLPWKRVDKNYVFDTTQGTKTLQQLFAGRSQLIVYHFMLGPDWEAGCKSCSFWADNFDGINIHLAHRDVTLMAISRAPLSKIQAYRQRMGWRFNWASANGSDFNFDFCVSFNPQQTAAKSAFYNFQQQENTTSDLPGISVFTLQEGQVFHTYSCYSRGIDMVNAAYQFLDLTPKGRDEAALPSSMSWVRRHDEYESV